MNLRIIVAIIIGMTGLCGCSSEGGGTIKAGGTVTVNGQPMQGLVVSFVPKSGRPATGITDSAGKFKLSTFASGDGAMPGSHAVTVAEPQDPNAPMPGTPEFAAASQKVAAIPAKYADPTTSGFSATVTAGEKNDFSFDIK